MSGGEGDLEKPSQGNHRRGRTRAMASEKVGKDLEYQEVDRKGMITTRDQGRLFSTPQCRRVVSNKDLAGPARLPSAPAGSWLR